MAARVVSDDRQPDDRPLVQQLLDGDGAAGDELARRHWDFVFATAIAEGADPDVAGDVAQDAFLRAAGAIKRWTPPEDGSLRPWLVTITRNLVRDHFRSGKVRFRSRQQVPDAPAADTDPSEDVVRSDLAQQVHQVLVELPEHYRFVIWRRLVDGASRDVVAAELGRSAQATSQLLRRALDAAAEVADGQGVRRDEV